MPVRGLPVRPDLEQLQRQAKEFLGAIHAGMRMRSPNFASTIPNRSTRLP